MSYLFLKLVHITSVIIFLGNITTGLYWAHRANKTRDFEVIASAFDGIIRSDRLFTVPGVIGILVSGFAAAIVAKLPILGTGWIFWPIVLFSTSGLVFGLWIAPLQRGIRDAARAADSTGLTWQEHAGQYKKWEIWGLVALIMPVAALAIMVLKPALPGL